MKLCMLIHVNIVYQLPCITTFLMDEALLSIILAGKLCCQLVKKLITLDSRCIIVSNFVILCIPATGMQKCDEASPSIILAGRALLVKMLITLEPDGIFGLNFVYLCILTFSSHWYEKILRGFTEHHFGRSSSFGEKNIVQPLV